MSTSTPTITGTPDPDRDRIPPELAIEFPTGVEPTPPTGPTGSGQGARVVPLPRRGQVEVPGSATSATSTNSTGSRSSTALVGPVVDAELIDDHPEPGTAIAIRRPAVIAVTRVVTVVSRAPQTRVVARTAVVVSVTTGLGLLSWLRRVWDASTLGVYRRQIRSAEAAGDHERLREWTDAKELAVQRRHDRLMDLPRLALGIVQVTLGALAGLVLLVLLIALVAQVSGAGTFVGVLHGVWSAVRFLVVLVTIAWTPLLIALPAGLAVAAYREGRRRGSTPRWLTRTVGEVDSWIDERAISKALAHLGIAPLDRFFKHGGELVYTIGARVDGDGTFAQIRLPMGVTADMVADRRDRLAANLARATLEVWPTTGDEAGVLDLWVADKGQLNAGAGDWPLLHDGQADVFAGVPIGRSQRGTVIEPPLFASNWLIGGRPGQGKSAAMRTLLLGAALDPSCELWVSVMGESPDFDPFQPRLGRYQMGMDDTVAAATVQALRDLLTEMERRGKVLGQQPGRPPKVSRKLADKPALGLHPLVLAIDECHELFMHPKHGKEAADLAVRLIKRGRKYGIVLILATQSPTKDSIPREVTRNVSTGVAFAVADHVANDGLLGAGKYKAGVRATDLRMHTDRGTAVAVGVSDAAFELIRWFYIPYEDDQDAVTPVIARAMALLAEHGQRTIPTTTDAEPDEPAVDFLADLLDVLGPEPRLRTQVVLARLAEHNPTEYEGWTFADLRTALEDHDLTPVKSDGRMVVRAADVTTAIAHRDHDGIHDPSDSNPDTDSNYESDWDEGS